MKLQEEIPYQERHQKDFKKGYLIFPWHKIKEKLGKYGKIENIWLFPYQIENVASNDFFYLSHLNGDK